MYEVELKVRAQHEPLRERLAELDADPKGMVEQVDTYYDHPVRDFAETDEAFRIRRETYEDEQTAQVTYKGPLVEEASKTRKELETGVDDGETVADILEELGFAPAATVEKIRERFEWKGYTVTLDNVVGLGEYVEVETESEAIEPARKGAIELVQELGLDPDQQIRTSYLGLLLEKEG